MTGAGGLDFKTVRGGFLVQDRFTFDPNESDWKVVTKRQPTDAERFDLTRDPNPHQAVVDAVGLRDRLGHKPAQLSGGQQQRVACARAMIAQPEVIFADEPTGNLDSRAGAEILAFLRRSVREHNQTIVMVTHDPNAASHADRVIFLADGAIVDEITQPTPDTVLDRLRRLDPGAGPQSAGSA